MRGAGQGGRGQKGREGRGRERAQQGGGGLACRGDCGAQAVPAHLLGGASRLVLLPQLRGQGAPGGARGAGHLPAGHLDVGAGLRGESRGAGGGLSAVRRPCKVGGGSGWGGRMVEPQALAAGCNHTRGLPPENRGGSRRGTAGRRRRGAWARPPPWRAACPRRLSCRRAWAPGAPCLACRRRRRQLGACACGGRGQEEERLGQGRALDPSTARSRRRRRPGLARPPGGRCVAGLGGSLALVGLGGLLHPCRASRQHTASPRPPPALLLGCSWQGVGRTNWSQAPSSLARLHSTSCCSAGRFSRTVLSCRWRKYGAGARESQFARPCRASNATTLRPTAPACPGR